jgi:hypothetical protein
MNHRTRRVLFCILILSSTKGFAHGGYFSDISAVTLSSHYLLSDASSDGRIGVGYRSGFFGIIGLCGLAGLEYRVAQPGIDAKLGLDAWIGFIGVRTDFLLRQHMRDEHTQLGASIGVEWLVWRSIILYLGANVFPNRPTEVTLGLEWMF